MKGVDKMDKLNKIKETITKDTNLIVEEKKEPKAKDSMSDYKEKFEEKLQEGGGD